jgi:Domain of unknown function (DUF3291)
MSVLVFTTSAIFLQRPGSDAAQGFFDRAPATIAAARRFAGYIAGSTQFHIDAGTSSNRATHPSYYRPDVHAGIACTLSLWSSVESAFAYSYSDAHAEALARRKEWFARGDWPPYAAWWASDEYVPSFADAAVRLDHLHAQGATSFAFDFKAPYDTNGARATVDRERVKRLIQSAQPTTR